MKHPESMASAPSCSVRVLTTRSEIDGEAAGWRALWDRCAGARTPYLSFEWISTWTRHFAGDGRLHVLVVEQDATAVAIVPLVRVRYGLRPFALDVLETVGGESRNLVALVAPGTEATAARAVALHLAADGLLGRQVLRVSLAPSEGVFLRALTSALDEVSPSVSLRTRLSSFAPYVPLPAVREDLELSIGRRRRRILARDQRRLDIERKDVHYTQASGDDVDAAMQRLFRLHEARWREAGVRGLFHDERNRAFHLDIARELDRLGWLDLSEMVIDGVVASACFVVVLDGVAYLMRSGRDISLSRYDAGHLHDLHLMRKWIGAGLREADFLRGAEPYKFYWTRRYRTYVEVLAARTVAAGGVPLRLAHLWMRVSRFLSHGHPPRELLAYVRIRRAMHRELRQTGIRLQPQATGAAESGASNTLPAGSREATRLRRKSTG